MGKDVQSAGLHSVDGFPSKEPVERRPAPGPISQGEIIGGRYRVDRIVAEGGMGIIVAATHLELEETVAIKFLRDEFASKPEVVGRFAREAKAAAKLKSEYVASVYDVGISPERGPYIVMEYLEGEDLETVLTADGRLPYGRACELMMQACEAIANAHANGIIHRDIKPANLFLVRRNGVAIVKVLDFGVSKTALTGNVFGGAISLVKTQTLVGSPIYMSPEALRGREEVTSSSDIWSIGAVLYELITGDTAFNGASITELCAAVLETEPTSICERVPEVPPELADVIMKCLHKEPQGRWHTVAELVCALAPFAPARARISIERVIEISKNAALLPQEFVVPTQTSMPAASMAPRAPASFAVPAPPQSLLETLPEDSPIRERSKTLPPATSKTGFQAPQPSHPIGSRRMLPLVLAAFGGAALAGIALLATRQEPLPQQPITMTVTTAQTPISSPAVTVGTTQRPNAEPSVAPPPAPSPKPATATRMASGAAGKAAPVAKPSAAPWAPAAEPQAPAPSTNVQSAIDDRK